MQPELVEKINEIVNKTIDDQKKRLLLNNQVALNNFKNQLNDEIKRYKHKELYELEHQVNLFETSSHWQLKRSLLIMRQQLIEQLFSEIKISINDFKNSEHYVTWLKNKIENFDLDKAHIQCHANDINLLKSIFNTNNVSENNQIQIGGFYLHLNNDNYLYDFSLDTLLQQQVDWLYQNADLEIEMEE